MTARLFFISNSLSTTHLFQTVQVRRETTGTILWLASLRYTNQWRVNFCLNLILSNLPLPRKILFAGILYLNFETYPKAVQGNVEVLPVEDGYPEEKSSEPMDVFFPYP